MAQAVESILKRKDRYNSKPSILLNAEDILMSNDHIYTIIGLPKTNEPEPEFTMMMAPASNAAGEPVAKRDNLIFTKRCLYPFNTNVDGQETNRNSQNLMIATN